MEAEYCTSKVSLIRIVWGTFLALFITALAACGGGGGGGEGSPGTPIFGSPGPSKLFVADSGNSVLVSFANPNPPPGVSGIDRIISGPAVSSIMPDLAYDSAADRLYIVNNGTIAVLDNASTTAGATTPARMISNSSIGSTIVAIYLDTVNDVLYVADASPNIMVFANVSTADGLIAPIRTLGISRVSGPVPVNDLFVDTTRDILYVSGHVGGAGGVNKVILVYDSANTINGALAANRELTFTASINGIVGDGAQDRLFVADTGASTVMVFDSVSAANGVGSPTRTINLPNFAQRLAVAAVSDRLYAITSNTLGVHIVNSASTANGVHNADRSIPRSRHSESLGVNTIGQVG